MPKEPLEDLPDVLDAGQLAEVLHLSRSGAYNLLNKLDFPTLRVGGKKMVMKQKLIMWMHRTKSSATCFFHFLADKNEYYQYHYYPQTFQEP